MIAKHSRVWWQNFSAAGVLACIASCSGPPKEIEYEGAIQGELAMYIATFDDGTTETHYALRGVTGDERRLLFHTAPDITPGAKLAVWGSEAGEAIEVSRFQIVSDVEQSLPLIGVTPVPPRRMCVAVVDLGMGTTLPSVTTVSDAFFNGTKSVNAFYKENSYGKNSLTGTVTGPYSHSMSTCDYNGLGSAIRPQLGTCDQYAFVFSNTSACSWSGLGAVGSPTKPAKDTWYNGTVGCVVTVQEPGHNYGMQHSSSIACGGQPFADMPDGVCQHGEYGDRFDPMGGGCRHMNVWQKNYQQWFGGCNSVRISSSGTFYLFPTEIPCNGPQALQVRFPGAKTRSYSGTGSATTLTSYYLEYRTSTGAFDTGMTPTVLLHVGADYRGATQSGLHTWLIDGHPATTTFNDAGYGVGESFSDPAGGLTITVQAMDATKATIAVNFTAGSGAPTCLDGTTFTPPGASTCTGGGTGGSGGAGGSGGSTTGTGGSAGASGSGGAGGAGGSTGAGGSNTGGQGGQGGIGGGGGGSATGGRAGSGGSAGTGGSSATGGAGGAGGSSATGGAGGTSATGGSGGSVGTGGAGGAGTGGSTGGSAGTVGSTSAGGRAGAGGSTSAGGGAGTTGAGGSSNAGGSAGSSSTGGGSGAGGTTAGTGGTAGGSGGAGSGGTAAGTGGSGGTGATTGAGGTTSTTTGNATGGGGIAGNAGVGGSIGTSGVTSTGSSTTGSSVGGAAGTTTGGAGQGGGHNGQGGARPKGDADNLQGACTCRLASTTAENERRQGSALLLALATATVLRSRRRARSASSAPRK